MGVSRGLVGNSWVAMDEATSASKASKAQEDETAESHYPLNNDFPKDAARNQDEHTEKLEDKTAEQEDTDRNNENTNDVNSALLQSDEPKSKVIHKVSSVDTVIALV